MWKLRYVARKGGTWKLGDFVRGCNVEVKLYCMKERGSMRMLCGRKGRNVVHEGD